MTNVRSSTHKGPLPSMSRRAGPPAVDTSHTWSPSPYATVDPSGDRRGCVSSQYGCGSRPVVRRSGGPPPSRSSSHTSEVDASSWMKVARSPRTSSDRGRGVWAIASRRQPGGGLTSRRGCARTPARSSLPTHIDSATRALLQAGQERAHERADRVEVITALLHDHGGQPHRAERGARRAVPLRRGLERALRIAPGGVDAERDDE